MADNPLDPNRPLDKLGRTGRKSEPLEEPRVLRCNRTTAPLRVRVVGMDESGKLVVEGADSGKVFSVEVVKEATEDGSKRVVKVAEVPGDSVWRIKEPIPVEVPCPPIDLKPQCEVVKWSRTELGKKGQ